MAGDSGGLHRTGGVVGDCRGLRVTTGDIQSKLLNNRKLLLVRATMIDKRYQRRRKGRGIVCNNKRL